MYKDSFDKNFSEQLSEALQSVKNFLCMSLFSNKAVNTAKTLIYQGFSGLLEALKITFFN